MSNYVKTTNFASKDTLASGNPLKTIKGTEFDVEFNNLATASATKANTAAPTFTGVPAAPTATAGNNTTQLATTAFVTTAVAGVDHGVYLLKTGGAMTGAITTNSTFDGVDVGTRDAVLTATTTTADAALPKAGGALTGAVTTNSTFDGRDVAADGATADAALPKAGGALTGAVTTNSTFDGRDVAADGATADAALPKAGGAMTGAITTNSTFDGVDIAVRDAILSSTTVTADAAQVPPTITGANVTAVNASYHIVSAGGITITLPASPSAGNYVTIKDGTGVAADTTFAVARNGSNIASSATDLTFDKNFAEIVMTYINSTIGWSV